MITLRINPGDGEPGGTGMAFEDTYPSVIYFGMTITRAEKCCLPQRSTEFIASAKITSDGSIWSLFVGVQSVSNRIETEAELDS